MRMISQLFSVLFLLLLFYKPLLVNTIIEPYDLPAIPPNLKIDHQMLTIPKVVWIKVYAEFPDHIESLIKLNPDWEFRIINDTIADDFMNTIFANTSVLWAYNTINPLLGAARADIWRFATLYVYGGCYIDDDSYLETPMSKVIQDNDEIVLGTERGAFHPPYIPGLSFSSSNGSERFGGKMIVQWLIFSRPFHPFIERFLYNVVTAVKIQYFKQPFFIDAAIAKSWGKLVFTTGPGLLTASIYEEIHLHPNISFRNVGRDFLKVGGIYKVYHHPHRENHWMSRLAKGADLLGNYYQNVTRHSSKFKITTSPEDLFSFFIFCTIIAILVIIDITV